MDVELLVVPNCPGAAPARDLLEEALARTGAAGHDLRVTVIAEESQAQQRRFTGSPTFLIDGADPFTAPGQPIGLCCRIYRDATGRQSNLPPLADLIRAIEHATEHPETTARA